MKKLLAWYDAHILKIVVAFLFLFIALYPKLPSIHIIRTWVYIRLEDFFIIAAVLIFCIQIIRRKVSLPKWLGGAITGYWLVGFVSLIFSIVVIAPQLSQFFPHIALLHYLRRIEYMVLFFVGFAAIRSVKDLKQIIIILGITLFGVILYGIGQEYYLYHF